MRLKDKISIVTGAANGIGRAIAIKLANEGSHVVVVDIEDHSAKTLVDEIENSGRNAIALKMDVSNSKETQMLAVEVLKYFDSLDVLVNCAGGPSPVHKYFYESDEEIWDRIININLKGQKLHQSNN